MTNGLETADAHQALALATEKVGNARRDLIRGLDEMVKAADELGLSWVVDDIRGTASDVRLETMQFPLVRIQVIGCLSGRIGRHETHLTGDDH
ncbi:hypothetical protein [Curtobacterium sp. MCBD17_040]|uniref:hypothetical protein n=1 Tax=Curtobacterium sp. MCBD17_040 TaxID=2175674 RepID=UPI000DA97D00|nr:hypothetical protein [Curtobacterium sp. MCBD17_040]WIB65805.1 hypothetical protein DEI94_16965 [Curtobacterium sp. MCBD17_040]